MQRWKRPGVFLLKQQFTLGIGFAVSVESRCTTTVERARQRIIGGVSGKSLTASLNASFSSAAAHTGVCSSMRSGTREKD